MSPPPNKKKLHPLVFIGRAVAAAVWVSILASVGYLFYHVLKPEPEPPAVQVDVKVVTDLGRQDRASRSDQDRVSRSDEGGAQGQDGSAGQSP